MCGSSQERQKLSEGAKINNCCQKSFQEAGCCSWREFEAGLVPRVARALPRLCSQSKPRHQVTSTQVSLASSQTNSPRSDLQKKWRVGIGGEVMAQHGKISSWLFKGWVFRKMEKLKFWRSFSVEFLNWVEGRPNFVFIFPLPCPKWKMDATWLTNDTQKFSAL